jgi:hypothetical protein
MRKSRPQRRFVDEYDRDRINFEGTLKKADPHTLTHLLELLQLVRDCFLSLLCQKETVHTLSAFGIYHFEAIHLLERACTEALCCYYGVANSMLRIALEALIRGAFWEGMAHKALRERAEVVRRARGVKINGELRRLHDWLADVFAQAPQAETGLELMSAAIFDRTSPLFSDPVLNRVVPLFKMMVEQVAHWGLLDPIADPAPVIYDGVYWKLSDDAHLIPDKTLLGRRFVASKPAFPTVEFSSDDLRGFVDVLEIVSDIGIVLSLNLTAQILRETGFVDRQLQALSPRMREILARGYCSAWKSG